MLLNYGRGRAEQFRLHPTLGSALNFVPPLFCLYLALWPLLGLIGLVPLACYGVAVACQTLASALKKGVVYSVAALPLLIVVHLLYGLGFWRGLFTRLKAAAGESAGSVELERIIPG